MFKATSEIAGNSPLNPSQNSFNYFVKTLKSATQAAYFIFVLCALCVYVDQISPFLQLFPDPVPLP